MRQSICLSLSDHPNFEQQVLQWASTHPYYCYLTSNGHTHAPYSSFDVLLAIGAQEVLSCTNNAFDSIKEHTRPTSSSGSQNPDWWFGYLSYDLKNEVEDLTTTLPDHAQLPQLSFFKPKHVITIKGDDITIESTDTEALLSSIVHDLPTGQAGITFNNKSSNTRNNPIKLQARMDREEYIETIKKLKQHIKDGDVYEINYCQEFYAEHTTIDPLDTFQRLNAISKAPFAALLRTGDNYAICSSPERFLLKQHDKIVSQPIKGTRKRSTNPVEDEALKTELKNSVKDRAENVMIVDLVRNDLARTCKPGSIKVEELFGIHSFDQVHHMISTITAQVDEETNNIDLIKNAFPMGSMTGAPKVRMMQLAEQYEKSARGLYSGSIGYFAPNGDFDLNVVIRTIIYNSAKQYLSYHVGGAIVWDSVPEEEYEECLLKAAAMRRVLEE